MHQVAFYVGDFAIHWYGIAWCMGFLWVRFAPVLLGCMPKMDTQSWYALVDYGLLAIVIGGRLGWVVFYSPAKLYQPIEALKLWQGGMSFHGAIMTGLVYLYGCGRYYGMSGLYLSDQVSLWVGPAIAIVRVANFYNGEIWGRVTTAYWGVVFPHVDGLTRHPSQLYEALLEGLLLFVFLHHIKHYLNQPGELTAYAVLFYASARLWVETSFRAPSYEWTQILSTGQILCTVMLLFGVFLLYHAKNRIIK
ncbi:prolipoprotein diacylglyceryl transferase [Gammaproteobacteria bacterium]|nr:prolipoprotein diacylglyceryl transferase [Gammaproteobacteria bacterium]